jgi:hypothetical protein
MTRALVVGCSDNVWQEVEAAQKLASYDAFYVVKMAGIHWDQGRFTWATLHPEFMDGYKTERRKLGLPDCYELVGPPAHEVGRHGDHHLDRRITYRWPGMTSSGASGLFAVKVALDDGHDRIVLAGVPMLREGGHFARTRVWEQRDSFMPAWTVAKPFLKGKVRSMSGWTKEYLGEPDAQWLSEAALPGTLSPEG